MAENDIPGTPPVPPQVPPPGSIPQEPPPSGTPVGAPQQAAPVAQGTNVLAILGLVAGILAVLCVFVEWIPIIGGIAALVGLALGTGAIVLSVMARKAAYSGLGGQGTAMGGLIMGIIGVVFAVLMGTCQAVCFSGLKMKQDEFNRMTPEQREELRKQTEEMHKRWQQGGGFGSLEDQKQREEIRKQLNQDIDRDLKEQQKEAAAKDNSAPAAAEPKDPPAEAAPKAGASAGDSPEKKVE